MMTEQELNQIRAEQARVCREKRIEKNLSQQYVADATGFNVRTINKFEQGNHWMGLRQYVKIKAVLGLPLT